MLDSVVRENGGVMANLVCHIWWIETLGEALLGLLTGTRWGLAG